MMLVLLKYLKLILFKKKILFLGSGRVTSETRLIKEIRPKSKIKLNSFQEAHFKKNRLTGNEKNPKKDKIRGSPRR